MKKNDLLESESPAKQLQNNWKRSKAEPVMLFFREIFKNPKAMGAACPSSSRLARAMADFIPLKTDGMILELGGGTGVITQALLDRGVDPQQLCVVERSPKLCHYLRNRFRHVNVIEADAAQLSQWIDPGTPISSVISGLPLRSLPPLTVEAISQQLALVLPKGCQVIQFTYDLRRRYVLQLPLKRLQSRIVWQNIPPARVDVSCYGDSM